MFGIDDIVANLIPVMGDVIKRIWPDPADQAKAQQALLEMQQTGELAQLKSVTDLALAQLDVDKVEAANPAVFVAGWRPAVGWACVTGVLYSVLLQPVLAWVTLLAGSHAVPPVVDPSILMTLLGTLLGIGGMKSFDMLKGTATQNIGK